MNFLRILLFAYDRLRLFGEEAAAQVSESTVSMINLLATMTGDNLQQRKIEVKELFLIH
jgi:hypothetical protein